MSSSFSWLLLCLFCRITYSNGRYLNYQFFFCFQSTNDEDHVDSSLDEILLHGIENDMRSKKKLDSNGVICALFFNGCGMGS